MFICCSGDLVVHLFQQGISRSRHLVLSSSPIWSEPMFAFVCQLVEVTREVDANETSVEDGLAFLDNLVGESN